MKLDVLVIAVHPDDAELGCAGTIIKMVKAGKSVGILDLTRGEMGSRGTPELRLEEAAAAGKIMGLSYRDNLGYRDGFFKNDEEHQLGIIQKIRATQPDLVITNAPYDRHPDHGRAYELVRDATFLSGLRKIETTDQGEAQTAWRPKKLYSFIQDHYLEPSFVVDVSPYFEQKMEAVAAFKSQFNSPDTSKEPETYISTREFWDFLEARARSMGHLVGVKFGEGFIADRPIKVGSPYDLL